MASFTRILQAETRVNAFAFKASSASSSALTTASSNGARNSRDDTRSTLPTGFFDKVRDARDARDAPERGFVERRRSRRSPQNRQERLRAPRHTLEARRERRETSDDGRRRRFDRAFGFSLVQKTRRETQTETQKRLARGRARDAFVDGVARRREKRRARTPPPFPRRQIRRRRLVGLCPHAPGARPGTKTDGASGTKCRRRGTERRSLLRGVGASYERRLEASSPWFL